MAQVFATYNAGISLVILSIGTVCNAVIIYAYFKMKSLHTINNNLLCQLAFVDLAKASLILPVKCYFQLKASQLVNEYICQLTAFISSFTYLHSSILLAVIAVVRYYKMLKPFKFEHVFSIRSISIYSALLIILNVTISLLPILGLGKYEFSIYHGICFADWSSKNTLYRTLFYVLTIGLNYPVIIFSYGRIYYALKSYRKSVKARANESVRGERTEEKEGPNEAEDIEMKRSNYEKKESSVEVGNANRKGKVGILTKCKARRIWFIGSKESTETSMETVQRSQRAQVEGGFGGKAYEKNHKLSCRTFRREIDFTKAMFTMFIAYSLCWLPAFFVNLFMLTRIIEPSSQTLFLVITLVELSVCLNPIIYVSWSSQYKKALRQLFCNGLRIIPD